MGVHVSFWIMIIWEYLPSSGIAGSCGINSYIPRFLRNLHIVIHSGCINLHFHQQSKSVPFSPHTLQHLLFLEFDDDDHSDYFLVTPHCGFDLLFSNNGQYWISFHVFIGHLNIFFGEMSKFSAHFFPHWVVCFSDIELPELLVYFKDCFVSSFICNYSLPLWGPSFQLVYTFLCGEKALKVS